AGIGEAEVLEGRVAPADLLRELDLAFGRQAEAGAALELLARRLDHRPEGMAVDQREEVVGEVDAADLVDIDHPGALAARRVGRVRLEEDRGARVATGHDLERALVQRIGTRGRVAAHRRLPCSGRIIAARLPCGQSTLRYIPSE